MELINNKEKHNKLYKKSIDNINIKFRKGKINAILCSSENLNLTIINRYITNKGIEINMNTFGINNKNISIVRQNLYDSFFYESVQKELEICLELLNYNKEKQDKHIKDAIKMVGLNSEILSRDPFSLSSGEMRKVAIAKGLVTNPKILYLEDPTIGLDNRDKNNLIKILKTIKYRYKKTIIIVSQDIEFIYRVVDYVFVLKDGVVSIEGEKYKVFQQDIKLKQSNIQIPKMMEFELMVLKNKNIKLGYRDEINDLIKDILRNV